MFLYQINLKASGLFFDERSFVEAFGKFLFSSPLKFFIEFYVAFSICEIVPRGRDKNCKRFLIERID